MSVPVKHEPNALRKRCDARSVAVKDEDRRIEALENGATYAPLRNRLVQAEAKAVHMKKSRAEFERRVKADAQRMRRPHDSGRRGKIVA